MRLKDIIKGLPIILGLTIFAGCEERDDISDRNRLYRLEDKFVELERLCNIINKNSENIKKLLSEQAKKVSISSVYKMGNGYIINFTDGELIELHNGKNGEDANPDGSSYVPVIGVKIAKDGLHYWTLDGEWLLDENGKMVLAEGTKGDKGDAGQDGQDGQGGGGVTPLMKIENGYWLVSYDEGKTWEIIGQATGEDGKDGADGICPQLKIENGIWYISYDNGETWEAIGSAVGQDGKTPSLKIEDGKLMISWDQGVTWEEVEGGDIFQGVTKPGTGVAQGYTWVDLGLPSGNKWATYNVGADNPAAWGKYYAWGDTISKSEYSAANCVTFGKTIEMLNLQGYTKGGVLTKKYDVAQQKWGGYWKIPTREDFQELKNECTWKWTSMGSVEGYEVSSKQEGNKNSIFLPAAGFREEWDLKNQGKTGWYWTSNAYNDNINYTSWGYSFSEEEGISPAPLSRRSGFSVRAIYVEP